MCCVPWVAHPLKGFATPPLVFHVTNLAPKSCVLAKRYFFVVASKVGGVHLMGCPSYALVSNESGVCYSLSNNH